MYLTHSPLEQFEIIKIIPIRFGDLDLSFTNSSFFCLLISVIIILFILFSTTNRTIIPNNWQSISENLYEFTYSLVQENIGKAGKQYFPFIFTVFLFILFANLIGMIPYSFTVTSHIIITFSLSLSIFIGVTIIGFVKHKLHFFSILLPSGTPTILAFYLVVIELVSYVARAFSLGVRLFANMMSGHSLLKILAGFSWSMLSIGGIFYLLSIIPLIVVFAVTGLEIGIALLQAYVFTALTCLYINDAINLH